MNDIVKTVSDSRAPRGSETGYGMQSPINRRPVPQGNRPGRLHNQRD
jgi:hypothetical protein